MILLLLFVAFSFQTASGQIASSVLAGVVRDSSGGVVSAAGVTATEEGTGFSKEALSGVEGLYVLVDLRPGKYTVSAEKDGFQKVVASGVVLAVNQRGRLDFDLKPGSSPQSITVTAPVSAVQADEASVGFRTEYESMTRLPLLGRDVVLLSTLGPGAVPRHLGGFVHDLINDVQPVRGAVALNPPIHGTRSYANRHLLDGAMNTDHNAFVIAVNPPLESVQEFRLITSLAAAEFPQGGGGVLDIVTRSGSSVFHGSAFEFFRNEASDARNFFDSPELARPIFRRNQFGGSLSGPVVKGRTFFFATYDGVREQSAKSSLNIVPDAALRGGDFRGRNAIFDPLNLDAAGRRRAFVGNQIPASRIDPIGTRFLERFQPLPNVAGAGGNYLDATPNRSTQDNVSGRIDHEVARGIRLFGRYTINGERALVAGSFPLLPTSQGLRAQQAVVGASSTHGSLQNEARFSFTRLRVFSVPESAFRNNIGKELGINGLSEDPADFGLPFFLVTNFNLRTDDPILPQVQRDNMWNFSEGLTWNRGRHSVRGGFQWTRFRMNYRMSRLSRGRLIFTGAYTSETGSQPESGDPFADFLIGLPQQSERNVGPSQADLVQNSYAGYVQDDWRVNRRLTVNFGLRYEYVAPFREERGLLKNLDYGSLPGPPRLVPVTRAVEPDRNNLAPRIGMALRLPGPLAGVVFRAGYGIYFSPEIAAETYDLVRNGVLNESNQTDGIRPVLTLRDPFPRSATTGLPGFFGIDPRATTPYVQQWTAGLQREVGRVGVIEMVYAASKGTRLGRFRAFNTPLRVVTGENLPPRPGDKNALKPFPGLGPIVQRQHIANSNYHSLEVKMERRFAGNLFLLTSFVWSKSIDDADSSMPGLFSSFGAQDERNLRLERGLSFHDVGRRLSGGVVYRLPEIRGLSLLSRNWEVSGLATIQDGTPLNPVYFAFDAANTGTPNRPDVVPGQSVRLPRSQRTADRFFNTDAFRTPAPFTFGSAGRNILPGPGNVVLDLALMRSFRLSEAVRMQVRGEAFNLPNHPNFGIPGPYPDFGPFFGKIFATGDPRRFQFSLRLDF